MEDPAQAASVANQKLYATRHLKIRRIEALQTGNAGYSPTMPPSSEPILAYFPFLGRNN